MKKSAASKTNGSKSTQPNISTFFSRTNSKLQLKRPNEAAKNVQETSISKDECETNTETDRKNSIKKDNSSLIVKETNLKREQNGGDSKLKKSLKLKSKNEELKAKNKNCKNLEEKSLPPLKKVKLSTENDCATSSYDLKDVEIRNGKNNYFSVDVSCKEDSVDKMAASKNGGLSKEEVDGEILSLKDAIGAGDIFNDDFDCDGLNLEHIELIEKSCNSNKEQNLHGNVKRNDLNEEQNVKLNNEQIRDRTEISNEEKNTAVDNGKCLNTEQNVIVEGTSQDSNLEHVTNKDGVINTIVKDDDEKSSENDDYSDLFSDDWETEENNVAEELDLSQWQRCVVLSNKIEKCCRVLNLKQDGGHATAVCHLEGSWLDVNICSGDIISILAVRQDGCFKVNSSSGLVVQYPNLLVSGTAVVGSLFCSRRALLQDRFKGIQGANKAMTIGSLVHELFQTTLSKGLTDPVAIRAQCSSLLADLGHVFMLYSADMSTAEASQEMNKFAEHIAGFVDMYMINTTKKSVPSKKTNKKVVASGSEWDGCIDRILDIEENVWSPRLGLKGKIDVTVEVTIHNKDSRKTLMPLELKTGQARVSSEHRGQVILYTMLMTDSRQETLDQGLLLFLREAISVHPISATHADRRDLVRLRNDLARYLAAPMVDVVIPSGEMGKQNDDEDPDNPRLKAMALPEPINHHSACGKCPYATLCSIYLSKDSSLSLPSQHPLMQLRTAVMGHLSESHISYFLHWCWLLALEDQDRIITSPLEQIWTMDPKQREKRGKCMTDMLVGDDVNPIEDKFEHTFRKSTQQTQDLLVSGLQLGEYAVVTRESPTQHIAIAMGNIVSLESSTITILLDRDLLKRNSPAAVYSIDLYESQSFLSYNLTNLGALVDNAESSTRLRSIIIDKEPAQFAPKLSRSVVSAGSHVLSQLNTVQQRAVLRALAAQQYMLIKGMPGTGKTQTIVCLVQILVSLGKSVLITSQTHSAVDNVLYRLKDSGMQMLRLGSSSRVHPQLLPFSEYTLTQHCTNPEQLHNKYKSMNVIGVTCLGSRHPLLSKRSFDVCIVDESTQVLQSSVLLPLMSAEKFILVGDPEQLPPIVRSHKARSLGLDESLFNRLDGLGATEALTLQYRMNGSIMALANLLTYQGQLQAANQDVHMATLPIRSLVHDEEEKNHLWLSPCLSSKLEDSVVFINTGNTYELCRQHGKLENTTDDNTDITKADKCSNVCEAALVVRIIDGLLKGGISKQEIGVIAPYRNQVALLKRLVSKLDAATSIPSSGDSGVDTNLTLAKDSVEVNTVDQFQGRDKQVIVYTCTRTWNMEKKGMHESKDNEILEDKRRLTVAITRAKYKLIIIGDVATLTAYSPFKQLLQCLTPKPAEQQMSVSISLQDLEKNGKYDWTQVMKEF